MDMYVQGYPHKYAVIPQIHVHRYTLIAQSCAQFAIMYMDVKRAKVICIKSLTAIRCGPDHSVRCVSQNSSPMCVPLASAMHML